MHRTYRVLVRGRFPDLDADQRAALIESLPAHTLWQAQFTEQGTLVFDAELRTFTFRVLVVEDQPDGVTCDRAAVGTGITAAELALDARGLAGTGLRATATCVEDIRVHLKRSSRDG